ncbi:hypothetical protein PMAYCL1PPCAC_31189, partial [Pristionchus mayeri]
KEAAAAAEKERLAKEKAEKDAAEKAAKEAKKKEEEERKAIEKAEKEAAKKAEEERKAAEKAEKDAAKKAEEERIAKEKAEAETAEAAAAAAAAQKAQEEAAAKAEAEAAAAKAEQEAKEKAVKEAAEEQAAKEAAAAAEQEAAEAAAAKPALEAEAIPKDADVEEIYELKREANQFAENEETKKGGKKNKKNKKNSESESASNGHTVIEDVQEKAYEQTVIPTEESPAETADAPAESQSKKSKKNKKGGKSEEIVAEPETNGHNGVEEIDYASKVEASATNGEETQFEPAKGKKSKKNKGKGGKQHSAEDKEDAPAQLSPPLQVNEITSTAEDNTTVLHAQKEIDNPTQFAVEAQKLAQDLLRKQYPDISITDDTMKMTIDAQLLKLAEAPKHPLIEHKPIVLACDRLVLSRPSTPSRDRLYKLLPKDIIFCSTLIDKYGDNFNAMAADESNVYRESARGLQRKIRIFKESPHFAAYTTAKAEGKTVSQWLEENPE